MLLLIAACTPPESARPEALYDPSTDDIWASPWPSDRYLRDDGRPDLGNFPNPFAIGLLDDYLFAGEGTVGWGNNAPVHFPTADAVDPDNLPTEPDSLELGAAVQIVDIDAGSPFYGERFPVQWYVHDVETPYQPEHLLSVAPVFGFPLRPDTTYAFLLTTDVVAKNAPFTRELEDDPAWKGLVDQLFFLGLQPDDVAIATRITTGNPVEETARMAKYVRENLESPSFALPLEYKRTRDTYRAYRTHYPGPLFTTGTRPYLTEGGKFAFTTDGAPVLQKWDDMRLAVCTPLDLANPPETGWPVVIFQHGTGGDYNGFCDENDAFEEASRFGERGIVGLGIDQPLHGNRTEGSGGDLAHFNILNPDSARTNFRQGALDALYLAHALSGDQVVLHTEDGFDIPIDPDRVMFMGHSQGGLTGALAAPWFGLDGKAMVLSGAGGGLAITISVRKDIVDFAQLVHDILQFSDDEEVHPLHPVVGLTQQLVEVTDPINYAPYWFSETPMWEGRPPHLLHFSGTEDAATPYATGRALAAAGRLPPVHPRGAGSGPLELRGLDDVYTPASDTAVAYDGRPITTAFSQWRGGTHFVVYQVEEASLLYADFLQSVAQGDPVIGSP